LIIGLVYAFVYNNDATMGFLNNETQVNSPQAIITALDKEDTNKVYQYLVGLESKPSTNDVEALLSQYQENELKYAAIVAQLPISDAVKYESGFDLFKHKIPMWIFLISLLSLAIWSFKDNLSLIPLLGLISCLYMMAELSVWNWIYFTVWLLLGLIIYFGFSRKNSKLNI
jgi:basic amino acid/polyamine antiporter, APA family